MRTVDHVALFLALHSDALWDKPSLPPGVSASHSGWRVAGGPDTLVTVILGQGIPRTGSPRGCHVPPFFLATTSVMVEEGIA